jgi:hypothetical protein
VGNDPFSTNIFSATGSVSVFKQAYHVSEMPFEFSLYTVFIVEAYQTCQYVVPRGGLFLYKYRDSFTGSSDGKIDVQSDCNLNT